MARLILNRDGVDLGTHELVPDMVMIGRALMIRRYQRTTLGF